MQYKGEIEGYLFIMKDNVIEVWNNLSEEFPQAYIYLKEGEIKNEKQFHMEIMSWWGKNKK